MTAPTNLVDPQPRVMCDVPGCDGSVLLDRDAWRRERGIPWPPDQRPFCAVSGEDPPFTYCPDHAFRYRGRTPTGRRWAAPRRPGCRLLRKGRPLRAYSADYQPCRCGAATDALRKTWGVRWRIPDAQGHILPGACPYCPGDLHVREFDARCPDCGFVNFFGCPYPEPERFLFRPAWATYDAPGCRRLRPPGADAQLPPGWRAQPDPLPFGDPYTYCPDHAFRYRGRTPQGDRCAPPRRRGAPVPRRRRGLRAYSTDRRPCACGLSARHLVAFWGARWRRPQPYGHITPHSCPQCDAALHVTEDCVKCLRCAYAQYYDYPNADY